LQIPRSFLGADDRATRLERAAAPLDAHLAFLLSDLSGGGVQRMVTILARSLAERGAPSGPREVLDHGRFGPLVPVGDDAALAVAIEQVLDDPPRSERLRARAELFTVERAVDRSLQLLFPTTTGFQPPALAEKLKAGSTESSLDVGDASDLDRSGRRGSCGLTIAVRE
jgi:hypothetical protein